MHKVAEVMLTWCALHVSHNNANNLPFILIFTRWWSTHVLTTAVIVCVCVCFISQSTSTEQKNNDTWTAAEISPSIINAPSMLYIISCCSRDDIITRRHKSTVFHWLSKCHIFSCFRHLYFSKITRTCLWVTELRSKKKNKYTRWKSNTTHTRTKHSV